MFNEIVSKIDWDKAMDHLIQGGITVLLAVVAAIPPLVYAWLKLRNVQALAQKSVEVTVQGNNQQAADAQKALLKVDQLKAAVKSSIEGQA